MNATATTARAIDLGNGLQVTIDERGGEAAAPGTAVLLLHGGAGPQSVAGLAAALSGDARVVTPVHPGFDGTPRPPWLDSAAGLADAYLDLLDALSLDAVTVIGNSIGGWIAAEMGLRDIHGQITSLVLLNANGIRPDNAAQVTDIRGLAPAEVGRLAFHNQALRPNPGALSPEQLAVMAANQQALATYAGEDFMKYCTYRSGVNVLTMTSGWSPGLANVCGAPGGTITSVPAGASCTASPTVNRAVPDTT